MSEDVNGGKRRIIVRRRSNGEGGNTATGNGNSSGNSGTNSASTISSGNGDNTTGVTSDGTENMRSDSDGSGNESEGMYSTVGSESERVGSNGSGGNNGESTDGDGDFLSFGITDTDSSGSTRGPGRGAPGRPRKTRGRKTSKNAVLLEQDAEDVKNIVIALGDAGSNATGFEGFKVHESEALTIARPAARILQRHGAVAETIRTVADPLSLIIATATVFGPRIAAYKMFKDMGIPMRQTAYEAPAEDVSAASQPVEHGTVTKQPEESFSRIEPNLFEQFQV